MKWEWTSNVKITAFDLDGNVKDIQEFKNLITTEAKNMVRDFLHGKTGIKDAPGASKVHDADGGFIADDVGKVLYNITVPACTIISNYVDATELDLTDDILGNGESYEILPSARGIYYIELGNDDGSVLALDVGNTALGGYRFRKIRTARSKPADGQLLTTWYIAPDEMHGQIEEIGWWAGSLAAAGEHTGILVSRVFYDRLKTEEESLQIERTDQITEVT
ncbi:hypothetical protein ES703_47339 [subsurface metagenome]